MERSTSESRSEVPSDITTLLRQVEAGQPAALDRLVEVAYPELRRIAHCHCVSKDARCSAPQSCMKRGSA
jgi:hypothetical protein